MNKKVTYNLNMIEKNNVNHQIMIFNLNITKKSYDINLRTLNYALKLNLSNKLKT